MARFVSLVVLLAGCGAGGPSAGPAWLAFAVDTVDVGPLALGETRPVFVPWACHGQGVVRVVGVRGDCGCARWTGLPELVKGGQRGRLRIDLTAGRREGPLSVRVRAFTDAARPHDMARLTLTGWVAPARNSEGESTSGR